MSPYAYTPDPEPIAVTIACPICAHRLVHPVIEHAVEDGAGRWRLVRCYGCGTERLLYSQPTRISAQDEQRLVFLTLNHG